MYKTLACLADNMDEISDIISDGGVIVFPTDTVYGIGCDPYCMHAVDRIYGIKGRDTSKPLPVLGSSVDELAKIVTFDAPTARLAEAFWPGQLTMILRLCDARLASSLHVDDRLAVRVPSGKCISSILDRCGLLVGTSANRSGMPACTEPQACADGLDGFDALVDGGVIDGDGESTILDLCSDMPRIIRHGAIPDREVLELA